MDHQKIQIVIPAMRLMTARPKKHRYDRTAITYRPYIGGYTSNPHKMRGSDPGRVDRWQAWREHARGHITKALTELGAMPPSPISSKGWRVTVEPFHQDGRHCDGTNVLKGLEDVLVWREKYGGGTFVFTDDKYLAGEYWAPQYDYTNPRVILTIERIGGVA